jgi:hypothetical protein
MFKTPLIKECYEMELGLQNYAIIMPFEKTCTKFNDELNGLQIYDIAQNHSIVHSVLAFIPT